MKKVTALLLSLALGCAAFLAGTWWQHRASKAGAGGERKALYWVDPMHPAYRSDRPGIAPDCGMQLEPVYAEGEVPKADGMPRPAGTVTVAADKQQLLGVKVAEVELAPSAHAVRLFGRVVPDETRVFSVNAAMEGSVTRASDVTTGARVRKGQWLGSVFSMDVRGPLQSYLTALQVETLDAERRREEGLLVANGQTPGNSTSFAIERLHGLGVSQIQLDEMKRTRVVPTSIDLYAPADGFVLARNLSAGQKYEKAHEWFKIASLDRVWILADVLPEEAALVRPGMKVKVAIPGTGRTLEARASDLLPQFDPMSRTTKVRLEAQNPGFALRPDMFVDVELQVSRPAALTVPADAVVDSGLRKTVFVERGEGIFEPRAVETGWRHGDRVQVTSGLMDGDRIVVAGTFLVDSESHFKAAANGVYGTASRDPVCGMDVDEARARAAGKTHDHGGKTFFFCSDQCKARFTAQPGQFAGKPERTKTAMAEAHATH